MRFRAEHRFEAPPGAVVAVLADPALYLDLRLPDVDLPELVEHRRDGSTVVLRLRYRFAGRLDPVAERFLASRRPTWWQELRLDTDAGAGSLAFAADAGERLLRGDAEVRLAAGGTSTTRVVEGQVVVGLPVVGRMAERRIVPGLLARLDVEAAAVRERLGG